MKTPRIVLHGLSTALLALSPAAASALPTGLEGGALRAFDRGAECDVRSFGARGDGRTKDTAAVQAAIDRCAAQGGTVVLRSGVFLTGTIRLRSGSALRIEAGATLKGTMDDGDYPDLSPPSDNNQLHDCRKALVYAESADQVTIEGGGTIDGSGGNPNWTGKEYTRPIGIFAAVSNHVTVQNVTLKNAGMWGVVLLDTDNSVVRGVTVNSLYHPNRDGIDIVDGHHILLENNTIYSDDDSICLKSGSSRGVLDVTARNNRVLHSGANGIKFGSASVGFFQSILFENNQLEDVNDTVIALESVDGAHIRDVRFRDIRFKDAGTPFYLILGRRFFSFSVGSIDGVTFERISGTARYGTGSAISGTAGLFDTYRIRNVTMSDVQVRNLNAIREPVSEPAEYSGQYPDAALWGVLPAYGLYLRHVDGFRMVNTQFSPAAGDSRPQLLQNDVTNFSAR